MVLATIIRLEMAYPGVGILAGDSLQYLSVVTAHAVIMVFFMIMPLLFGAFGNFLLPTQLGVHDVAFPRLNSAAFWFLPAGLREAGHLRRSELATQTAERDVRQLPEDVPLRPRGSNQLTRLFERPVTTHHLTHAGPLCRRRC